MQLFQGSLSGLGLRLLLLGGVAGWPIATGGHEDLPGPPVIQVEEIVRNGTVLPFGGSTSLDYAEPITEAEFLLVITVNHIGHGTNTANIPADVDLDATATIPFSAAFWNHDECSPVSQVALGGTLIEVDSSVSRDVLIAIAGAAAGIALASAGAGVPVSIAITVVGAGLSIASALNGNESFGQAVGIATPNTTVVLPFRGPDGNADIPVEDITGPPGFTTWDCLAPVAAIPLQSATDRTAGIYDSLEQAVAMVGSVAPEPAEEPGMTAGDVADIQEVLTAAIVGLAELAVASEIEDIPTLEGVGTAIELFEAARVAYLESGDLAAGVADFRAAYSAAANAREMPSAVPATRLSLQLISYPDVVTVRPTQNFELRGLVAGLDPLDSIVQINLFGQDTGMETESIPGSHKQLVQLSAALSPTFPASAAIGLKRVEQHRVAAADPGCPAQHLEDASFFSTGITIDGQGPFPEPDPTGCGYGAVITTTIPLFEGGTPPGADFSDSSFIMNFAFEDVLPGRYAMMLEAEIDTPGGTVFTSRNLTLIVANPPSVEVPALQSWFGRLALAMGLISVVALWRLPSLRSPAA